MQRGYGDLHQPHQQNYAPQQQAVRPPIQQHQGNNSFRYPRESYSSSPDQEDFPEEEEDAFIEISLSEPHKVGEGISSYLAYRVTTRTDLKHFGIADAVSISRRFSDFLGLHEKLSDKYLPRGRVIPPAPEKSLVGTTKVKMSSSAVVTPTEGTAADFVLM